jgi:hypothetical protein
MEPAVERYQRDGYVTFEETFPADRLARLRDAGRRLVARIPEWGRDTPRLVWRREAVNFITFPADLEPAFAELLTDDWVLERLRPLLGPDIEYYEGSLVVKGPGENTVFPWHQDLPHIPHSNSSLCAMFLHLDDFTDGQGALSIIPGTHTSGIAPHRRGTIVTTEAERSRGIKQCVPAGTLTIMHSLVWHEGTMSRAANLRTRALCFFRAADCAPLGNTGEKPDEVGRHNGMLVCGSRRAPRHEAIDYQETVHYP